MSNPFDFFEEIYCINLSYRTDKWKMCLEQFEKLNIHKRVERFEAIKFEGSHPYVNIRSAGCFASHRAAINLIKERNLNNALIFEDDVEFITNTENTYKNLKLSIEELKLQKYWDIFYLGMHVNMDINKHMNKEHIPPLERISSNLLKVNTALCAHAQAYSKEASEIISSNIPPGKDIIPWLQKNESVDGWILRHMLPRGTSFSTNEFLATQRECFSDNNLVMTRLDKHFATEFNKLRPV
jgi:GR25 family glycosyltransferase involved in LPS biosynthesis